MKRGKNSLIVGFTFLGILFAYFAFDLHKTYGKIWLTLIPIGFFIIFIFVVLISNSYRDKLKQHSRSSRLKLVGFNMDFNELIFKRIYGSLTRYEYLDENRTSFSNFYEVMVLDFNDHESVLHFSCTQPQLKYILDRFKQLKKTVWTRWWEMVSTCKVPVSLRTAPAVTSVRFILHHTLHVRCRWACEPHHGDG